MPIYPIEKLDGFFIDRTLNRTVHLTFETESIIVIDLYDTVDAAYSPVGECLSMVEINLEFGKITERR